MKILALVLILFFISCKESSEIKPSEIHYGTDICERCKMIISDKEFSSQLVLKNKDIYKFDDVGGMVNYIQENNMNDNDILKLFVIDYKTKNWVDGRSSHYVWSKDIKSPMGYNIISFETKASAEEFLGTIDGKFIGSYKELTEWIKRFGNGL